ncbi:hypothetical protein [Curtobacterium sp. SAFR-003]|uniref:hypothetical protein n=1 Tax=Curtobacterium sp. SAFR-003 TaxID=3387276 RepID=UPI000B0F8292
MLLTGRAFGLAGVGLLCVAAMAGTSTVAFADDTEQVDAMAAVEGIAPEVLEGVASPDSADGDASTYVASGVDITVPKDAGDGAVLQAGNHELTVSLPFANQAATAVDVGGGLTTFDNQNSSTTAPIAREDGSLQILTIIDDASAPTRYDYDLSVPSGGQMTIREDGVVIISDRDGGFAGTVAPAWAKDATGAPIGTHYEVQGNTLTQVVEHAPGTQYPVVADPWLGITLFKSFKRDTYHGDHRYSAWVTGPGALVLSGGGGVGGYAAGQAVFRGAGWDEWKAKWPAITNKATLQQQYNCHVAASVYGLPFTQDYNLERYRANRSNWVAGVASHRCNW